MPYRPSFPIPEDIHAEPFCLCIQVPNDPTWKQVVAGLLDELNQWYNWQRDEAKSGKDCAQVWRNLYEQIDWTTMSCCCDNPPDIFKYIGTELYRSTDGGATFEPAPLYDYRNNSTYFPKPSELGLDQTRCQAADSVVVTVKEQMVESINNDAAVAGIIAAVVAVLVFFLTAGSSVLITAQIAGLAAAIFGAGVATWKAAFTSDVWDEFRCLIEANMDTDESIDQAGYDALYGSIDGNFTGIVVPTLKGYISAMGLVGINNMMASNVGSTSAICCPACDADNWDVVTYSGVPVGTIISRTGSSITVQGTSHPDFGTPYNAMIQTAGDDICCVVASIELISGTTPLNFGVNCGDPRWPGSSNAGFTIGVSDMNTLFIRGDVAPFVVKITFQ